MTRLNTGRNGSNTVHGSGILAVVIVAGLVGIFGLRAPAHTLPISYVFVVTDKDYVHLELSFNPFELATFSEFETNKNGMLDPEELTGAQDKLTHQLLAHLILSADGKPLAAETAGLSPEADSHHASLRAHYRVDAARVTLTLESTLREITSSSHLSQVNFVRDGKPQLAQLDSQSHKVTFAGPVRADVNPARTAIAPANSKSALVAVVIAFAISLFVSLRGAKRNTSATKPENSSHLKQPPKP